MALINCNFFSDVLGMSTAMTVILPQNTTSQIGMTGKVGTDNIPVLYLLHGYSDDHTIWLRRTSIERYVAELGIAVIMPNVHLSYYTNMVSGGRYWDFISEELPQIVKSFFNVSDKREDTFVAGLSMGGYGALKLAFNYPERFAAAASLSGVVDINQWVNESGRAQFEYIFGEHCNISNTENDIVYLARKAVKENIELPAIYQCCGTEDFLYDNNLQFKAVLEELDIKSTYAEAPGVHNWEFWDEHIQNVLKWLPINGK